MQILVLYHSRSGHTKKLAEAVAKGVSGVPGVQAALKNVAEVTRADFLASEGVIAGSPVYYGSMAAELKKVLDDFNDIRPKMEGKVGAAFATSWDPSGGKETTLISILQAWLIYGMVVAGDPMEATGHYGTACSGEPDAKTLKNGEKLGKRVAEIAKKLRP